MDKVNEILDLRPFEMEGGGYWPTTTFINQMTSAIHTTPLPFHTTSLSVSNMTDSRKFPKIKISDTGFSTRLIGIPAWEYFLVSLFVMFGTGIGISVLIVCKKCCGLASRRQKNERNAVKVVRRMHLSFI
jgi:hypothetical protein